MDLFDDVEIEIPCPDCGTLTHKTIGWIKSIGKYACLGCGRGIVLDPSDLIDSLKEVDDAIGDLSDTIDRLNEQQ